MDNLERIRLIDEMIKYTIIALALYVVFSIIILTRIIYVKSITRTAYKKVKDKRLQAIIDKTYNPKYQTSKEGEVLLETPEEEFERFQILDDFVQERARITGDEDAIAIRQKHLEMVAKAEAEKAEALKKQKEQEVIVKAFKYREEINEIEKKRFILMDKDKYDKLTKKTK